MCVVIPGIAYIVAIDLCCVGFVNKVGVLHGVPAYVSDEKRQESDKVTKGE